MEVSDAALRGAVEKEISIDCVGVREEDGKNSFWDCEQRTTTSPNLGLVRSSCPVFNLDHLICSAEIFSRLTTPLLLVLRRKTIIGPDHVVHFRSEPLMQYHVIIPRDHSRYYGGVLVGERHAGASLLKIFRSTTPNLYCYTHAHASAHTSITRCSSHGLDEAPNLYASPPTPRQSLSNRPSETGQT
jgi:hypothetical protein